MQRRSSSPLRAAAAASLLLAGACSDLTTPDTPAASAPRASAEGGAPALVQPALHLNRTRYHHHGQKPATGRSGSATLTMQALVGRDGSTEVFLSTGHVDYPWVPGVGSLTRARTKASTPGGRHLFTRSHGDLGGGSTATLTLGGLARGMVLEVQGNVTDVDPSRTGVVTVTGTVYRRPNLAVTEIVAPPRVRAGSWTNIAATIRETNGDVGNWSTCVMYVDGMQTDWGRQIWVDAGDVVTCAFTHNFQAEGAHDVEVRLEDLPGIGRDDDPSDNSARATVEAATTNELFYSAYVNESAYRSTYYRLHRWSGGGYVGEELEDSHTDSRGQTVSLSAWLPRGVAADPLRMEVAETSGGVTIGAGGFAMTPDYVTENGSFCAGGIDPATGARHLLCSDHWGSGSTYLSYSRYAGSVTYHSVRYSRVWNGLDGTENVYSYNEAGASDEGSFSTLGNDFALRVRLYAGDEVFTADPSFPLSRYEGGSESPYSCWTYQDPFSDYASETCAGSSFYVADITGRADG